MRSVLWLSPVFVAKRTGCCQVFSILRSKCIAVPGDIDDLRFVSDVARQKGVASLTGVDGMLVTPYERTYRMGDYITCRVGGVTGTCYRCFKSVRNCQGK